MVENREQAMRELERLIEGNNSGAARAGCAEGNETGLRMKKE
jgi:hypothetical protein